ncbi:MAG: F420-nonreducing hydrogenase [Euryarchaeota archaeon RBG_16_67_27]|nr:MAG: F420-nonreducing hydrogenase [Euryarchaeota archaeon RBG_16_67_27]
MPSQVVINPITRLEGHGKVTIFLDDKGEVSRAYLQIPELRGFENFLVGRQAEDAPQITSRICGVCPTAHHTAATKALDDLYKVDPPPTAKMIREMLYSVFMLEDHALHLFFLGGPDFVVGPTAPKAERNVVGVIQKAGIEIGKQVIAMRKDLRGILTELGGKVIHPVYGLPGGVAKPVTADMQVRFKEIAARGLKFASFCEKLFEDVVLGNPAYVKAIMSEGYTHRTYYMGLVDEKNRENFYDGQIRVVNPSGSEVARFPAQEYLDHIAEHSEPWTYVKFPFLKKVGWKGFVDGPDSGVYSVAPMARLNVCDDMATPQAAELYEKYFETLGGKPVHHTLANHWARVIEIVYAAERFNGLVSDARITDPDIRTIPTETPKEGVGVVEAPRGTLIHHYKSDDRGILTSANLIVATQHNSARIAMSVDKAARAVIHKGVVDDGILNQVEMAFRAYDPCHACATHSLPGRMPLLVTILGPDGTLLREIRRDG